MNSVCHILRIYTPRLVVLLTWLSLLFTGKAQVDGSVFLHKPWKGSWIMLPGTNPTGYGVYYFRKVFELNSIPNNYPVLISADNSFKLFVNEKLVSIGPAQWFTWKEKT